MRKYFDRSWVCDHGNLLANQDCNTAFFAVNDPYAWTLYEIVSLSINNGLDPEIVRRMKIKFIFSIRYPINIGQSQFVFNNFFPTVNALRKSRFRIITHIWKIRSHSYRSIGDMFANGTVFLKHDTTRFKKKTSIYALAASSIQTITIHSQLSTNTLTKSSWSKFAKFLFIV